jgi:hypothetical protein
MKKKGIYFVTGAVGASWPKNDLIDVHKSPDVPEGPAM